MEELKPKQKSNYKTIYYNCKSRYCTFANILKIAETSR